MPSNFFKKRPKLRFFLTLTAVLVGYTLITLLLYKHRLTAPFTQYAMPDVDTDGGIWYNWFLAYIERNQLVYDVIDLASHPFGFDIAFSPVSNIIYSTQVFILNHVLGFSWQNLIFITNVSSLIVYPLSAFGTFLLAYYLTRNTLASFLGGLLYAFSFYVVLMGRGQMSINHVEIMPFYLLSVMYFLDRKTSFSLVLSTLFFALMFKADAYYAFFSGIFSVIFMVFYRNESLIKKLKTMLIYYSMLFTMLVLVNINFIIGNLYLFNKAESAQTGRNSTPENELLQLLYYFTMLPNTWWYSLVGRFSAVFQLVPLAIALAGLYITQKRFTRYIFFFGLIVCIMLSANTPIAFWINQLYFRYFGMFRGVSRMAIPAGMFLGVLVAMSLDDLSQTDAYKKLPNLARWGGFILLAAFFVSLGLNVDGSWYRNTNLANLAALYEPVKNNPDIKVLAPYPMTLSSGTYGFPQPYQIMGQVIHEKKFASGISPFDPTVKEYYQKISDLENDETIAELTKYGIDTIIIYNHYYQNQKDINEKLQKDARLRYLGRFTSAWDVGSPSSQDYSKDISLYQITEVVERNKQPQPLFFSTTPGVEVEYQKIDAAKYIVSLQNIPEEMELVFNSPYTPKWQLFAGDHTSTWPVTLMKKVSPWLDNQERFSESKNVWKINAEELKREVPPDQLQLQPNGQLTAKMTVYFYPQARYATADFVANTVVATSLIFLGLQPIFGWYRKRLHEPT